MKMENIYRLKSLNTKKFFWIISAHSDFKNAIRAKRKQKIKLESDKALEYPDQIILDKNLGQIAQNDVARQYQLLIDDISIFKTTDVMSQRLNWLYLGVTEDNFDIFHQIITQYPQIDLGPVYSETLLQDEQRIAQERLQNSANPNFWQAVINATTLLINHYQINDMQVDNNTFKSMPFNLNKVKIDQDGLKPVFYDTYYPTHFLLLENDPKYSELNKQYVFIRGLKYKIEDEFPLKVDGDRNDSKNRNYKECLKHVVNINNTVSNEEIVNKAVNYYSIKLESLLNFNTLPLILVALPAHNIKIHNIVSRIVKKITSSQNVLIDGSELMIKKRNESEAHSEKGMLGRNTVEHEKSWSSNIKKENISPYLKKLPIIVIDDLTTSGSSLKAADHYFTTLGFTNIFNFVFGKSTLSTSIVDIDAVIKKYDGVVIDLDQTFYDSAHKDNIALPYFKDLLDKLEMKNIKYIFVTQSSRDKVIEDCGNDDRICHHLYLYNNHYTVVERNNNSCYKPNGQTIFQAVHTCLNDCQNILGVGNNENDIIAYRRAGIDTALATWGNSVKNIPTTANYVINNEQDLLAVLENGVKYLDKQDID